MPKIKMSDIKSGSENVKKVFRLPMSSRSKWFLEKIKFSNNDLLEILDLADNKEYHKDSRQFIQKLILSQSGPFNLKVFKAFSSKTFYKEALIHLMENTKGLDEEAKTEFIKYAILVAPVHFISNFFMNGESTSYGMDVKKSPYNRAYAYAFTTFADSGLGRTIKLYEVKEYNEFLFEVLDTLTESQILDWYNNDLKRKSFRIDLITSYYSCPKGLFLEVFEQASEVNQQKLAKHPNCPEEVKLKLFDKTGDASYLPDDIANIFEF